MAGIDFLLKKIDEGWGAVASHYEADLAAQSVSDELLYAVRAVIQDSQSALDWTASVVRHKCYGDDRRPYFPLAKDPADFQKSLSREFAGLETRCPQIAAAIERHQPYQPGHETLGYLHALSRVNKHQDFTPQTRHEHRTIETRGVIISPDLGTVEGVWVDGEKVWGPGADLSGATLTVYVDWRFVDPAVSVLPTLRDLAALVRNTTSDVLGQPKL